MAKKKAKKANTKKQNPAKQKVATTGAQKTNKGNPTSATNSSTQNMVAHSSDVDLVAWMNVSTSNTETDNDNNSSVDPAYKFSVYQVRNELKLPTLETGRGNLIETGTKYVFSGVMTNGIDIGGIGAKWGTSELMKALSEGPGGVKNKIDEGAQMLQALAGREVAYTLKSLAEGLQMFQGGQPFTFSITSTIIATTNTNPLKRIMPLFQYSLPGQAIGSLGLLTTPGGYAPFFPMDARGFMIVHIGEYMRIPNLILQDVSFKCSPEMTTEGFPLKVDVTLKFQTFRAITYEDVIKWFIK